MRIGIDPTKDPTEAETPPNVATIILVYRWV